VTTNMNTSMCMSILMSMKETPTTILISRACNQGHLFFRSQVQINMEVSVIEVKKIRSRRWFTGGSKIS
jgi:hypothetical protein